MSQINKPVHLRWVRHRETKTKTEGTEKRIPGGEKHNFELNLEDMTTQDGIVFICGESKVTDLACSTKAATLRELILANLAVCWATRTHPPVNSHEPKQDLTELSQTIARSHVFVFIYSKETIGDRFFLNQYGIAKAHGVPVVGVRLANYFLPNHLPEQYYFTEIVTYSSDTKSKETLADSLISDFKGAMVYARDFHKSCIERLRHKVKNAYNRKERGTRFVVSMSESPPRIETKQTPKTTGKCPRCGHLVRSTTPKLQRASSTGALLRRSEGFETETNNYERKPSARGRTPFQPATIQIPTPFSTRRNPVVAKTINENWTGKKSATMEPFKATVKTKAAALTESHEGSKENEENLSKNSETERSKALRRQSRTTNTWTDRLKNKLRRQSSLPVIPTTYLVTTPDGLEKQISFVKYPPDKPEPSSRRCSGGLPLFSEDEELETIHISRAPSPETPSV